MEQPEGYRTGEPIKTACKLKKSLYGLKQSSRTWNSKFNELIVKMDFLRVPPKRFKWDNDTSNMGRRWPAVWPRQDATKWNHRQSAKKHRGSQKSQHSFSPPFPRTSEKKDNYKIRDERRQFESCARRPVDQSYYRRTQRTKWNRRPRWNQVQSGGAVRGMSRRQRSVSLSTTEADDIAVSETAKDIIWTPRMLEHIDQRPNPRNPEFHRRTKHIEIKYHFVKEQQEEGNTQVENVGTKDQLVDIMTKALWGANISGSENQNWHHPETSIKWGCWTLTTLSNGQCCRSCNTGYTPSALPSNLSSSFSLYKCINLK